MALLFDATDERVQVPAHASIDDLSSMTLMIWYQVTTVAGGTAYCVINKHDGTAGDGFLMFRPGGAVGPDDWWFIRNRATTDTSVQSNGNIISTNRWEWICVMDSDGVAPDLLHGTLAARAAAPTYGTRTTGSGATAGESDRDLWIGNSDGTQPHQGRIGLVQIFNRRLTPAEALLHQYRPHVSNGCVLFLAPGSNGVGTQADWSGNANNGAVTGATVVDPLPLGPLFGFDVPISVWEAPPANGVTITTPANAGMFFQQDSNGEADIVIAGTYTGSPTAIEADFNGGGYETIDASPSGGTFSGTLLAQAAGQGTLTVRFTNDTGASDTLANVLITDVIALIGQSNIGYAQNNDTPSGAGAPMMYNITAADSSPYTAGAIVALADPINNETGEAHGSPWPHFAELYYADYGYPPAFVVGYKGGTGLVGATSHWDKDGDGTYYDRMVTRLSALATLGLNDICCFFWDQGGADVADGTTKAAYKAAQSAMLDNFQADMSFFDNPSTVKLVAVAFENWCTATTGDNTSIPSDDDIDAIRFAHIESWTEDGDILPGPTGHDQKFGTGAGPGGVHWYTDAERERLGKRWYRCFKAHYGNGTEPARGPQVSTIEIASAVVTVTFAGGVSPLQNGTTIQGWEVKDDGTPVTIDSVAINGSNSMAIDITLNSTPSGVVTVSWAHGNDAAANPLVDSGTIAEFPPEPFVDRGLTVAATGRKRRGGMPNNRLGPFRW